MVMAINKSLIDIIAVQLVSTTDIEQNFAAIETQLKNWHQQHQRDETRPCLVVLPESFAIFGGIDGLGLNYQEQIGDLDAPIQGRLVALAKQYQVWLAGGTIPTVSPVVGRCYATLTVFDPQGNLVEHYQKIHLFDVDVNDRTGCYRESDTTLAGERVVVFDLQGITVGLAVCYDVRFPGLFQALTAKGAQMVLLPSAFTCPTGQAHWQSLITARAIENQIYMVAPAQGGVHANGRATYGHSLIVDPWGVIMAEKDQGSGFVTGRFDSETVAQVRGKMPLQQHNRFKYELINESISRA
jgi:predicted amidohydrolase